MWHEARKQEKKIRGILVNHKKRAERRREFYEKIKADPTQFLQLHGRPARIHLDPAVALAADSPANIMPWQGRSDILIDRFDVRAHLDFIPELPEQPDVPSNEDLSYEDRMANYERYRIIVQNDFLGIEEHKFLHQLNIEEKFGPVEVEKKTSKIGKGAAIPYSYEDSTPQSDPQDTGTNDNQEEEEEEDDSDIDFDLCVDVNQVNVQQAADMNVCGSLYGMTGNDFFSFLTRDIEEKESLRQAREQEEEKAMFSGRKSRRERRAYREKRLQGRKISPPSYAARSSPTYDPYRKSESKSPSRSRSPPVPSGQITYITSFGGEEEETGLQKPLDITVSQSKTSTSGIRNLRRRTTPEATGFRHRSGAKQMSPVRFRDRKPSAAGNRSPAARHGRTRSPREGPKYRRGNRSRSSESSSRSASETSKLRRNNRSCSPDSPRHRRHRSSSRSPSRYRRSNRSRSSESSRHRRSRRSRSQSYSPKRNKQSRSRSPRYRRGNKSRSKSSEAQRSRSHSPPPPPVRRYYGSKRGKSSSLELESSDDSEAKQLSNDKPQNKNSTSEFGNSGAGSKHQPKVNARDRLKKKMQTLLNRQYKADKKAERVRVKKQEDERQEREDELREMAIKLRRRERERRHRDRGDSDDESGSWRSSSSDSSRHSPPPPEPRHGDSNKSWRSDSYRPRNDRESASPETKKHRLVDY